LYYPHPHILKFTGVFIYVSTHFRWGGVCRGEEGWMHRVLVGKPEGRRSLVRPSYKLVINIKMELREVEGGGGDWMKLAHDRDRWWALVSKVKKLWVP
jgi:hypothetical protein